jgi:hypothetical protein
MAECAAREFVGQIAEGRLRTTVNRSFRRSSPENYFGTSTIAFIFFLCDFRSSVVNKAFYDVYGTLIRLIAAYDKMDCRMRQPLSAYEKQDIMIIGLWSLARLSL